MSNPSGTPCKAKCCEGGDCVCNDSAKHPHTTHVCCNPRCPCHTAAYHVELTHDDAGREYYVPQGSRLVRKGKQVQP